MELSINGDRDGNYGSHQPHHLHHPISLSGLTSSRRVVLSFSQVAEVDFSFALGEGEPRAAWARPAVWVPVWLPVAEAMELACSVAVPAAGALAAAPVVDAAAAELALACSVAEASAADALVAEPVAGAAVVELALAYSVAAPVAGSLGAELAADAALAGPELVCSALAGPLAADESAAGLAVEPVAGARKVDYDLVAAAPVQGQAGPRVVPAAVDCDWAARFAAPRLVAELSWAVARRWVVVRRAQDVELERGAQELQRRRASIAESVERRLRQRACRD